MNLSEFVFLFSSARYSEVLGQGHLSATHRDGGLSVIAERDFLHGTKFK